MGKILICDDEPSIRFVARLTLQHEGHEVVEVEDGEDVLPAIREHHPDVLIVDANMPGWDGWRVVEEMREAGLCETTRVVLMTGSTGASTKQRAREAGIDAYLPKPFDIAVLASTVASLLPKQHTR